MCVGKFNPLPTPPRAMATLPCTPNVKFCFLIFFPFFFSPQCQLKQNCSAHLIVDVWPLYWSVINSSGLHSYLSLPPQQL